MLPHCRKVISEQDHVENLDQITIGRIDRVDIFEGTQPTCEDQRPEKEQVIQLFG